MNRSIPTIVARRLRRRRAAAGAAAGLPRRRRRCARPAPPTRRSSSPTRARCRRAGLRHGGRPGPARGRELARELEKRGVEVTLRDPPGRRAHARPHERAAGRGRRALRPAQGDGRHQPASSRAPTSSLVIGANDVTNPAANDQPDSPIYGMPILEVDQVRQSVIVLKRSMNPGFAGIDNQLFYDPKTPDAVRRRQGLGRRRSPRRSSASAVSVCRRWRCSSRRRATVRHGPAGRDDVPAGALRPCRRESKVIVCSAFTRRSPPRDPPGAPSGSHPDDGARCRRVPIGWRSTRTGRPGRGPRGPPTGRCRETGSERPPTTTSAARSEGRWRARRAGFAPSATPTTIPAVRLTADWPISGAASDQVPSTPATTNTRRRRRRRRSPASRRRAGARDQLAPRTRERTGTSANSSPVRWDHSGGTSKSREPAADGRRLKPASRTDWNCGPPHRRRAGGRPLDDHGQRHHGDL